MSDSATSPIDQPQVMSDRTIKAEFAAYSHLMDSITDYFNLCATTANQPPQTPEEHGTLNGKVQNLLSGMLADLDFLDHRHLLSEPAYLRRQNEICTILGENLPAPTSQGTTTIQ